MKVIWFNGNLGNQVFYCAYKDYLQRLFPQEKIYAFIDPNCPVVTVAKYFNLTLPKQSKLIDIISFIVFKLLGLGFRRIPQGLIPRWYCGRGRINDRAIFFANNLQDKSFYENLSSDWLQIKIIAPLPNEYKYFEKQINGSNSICVHLRRGDYVRPGSSYVDLSCTDYYQRAMSKAKDLYPDCHFFFFSDDLDFVKRLFKGDNIHYVDCNRGINSYLDIKLMSMGKVNIIANSTFSYWAAYINHENKYVIYPTRWFNEFTGRESPHIMLNSWIGI